MNPNTLKNNCTKGSNQKHKTNENCLKHCFIRILLFKIDHLINSSVKNKNFGHIISRNGVKPEL